MYTRIYVEDEGVGIPENELVNIFKRFYRVHNEVNPNSVGIGLSLAKSIVELASHCLSLVSPFFKVGVEEDFVMFYGIGGASL